MTQGDPNSEKKGISRREFLETSGKGIGAAAATGAFGNLALPDEAEAQDAASVSKSDPQSAISLPKGGGFLTVEVSWPRCWRW